MSEAGRTGIYGASGSGKTTLLRQLVRDEERLVLMALSSRDWIGHGLRSCPSIRAVKGELVKGFSRGRWRLLYVPPANWELEALHHLSVLLREVQDRTGCRYRVALAVDELGQSFPNQKIPRELMGFGELCSRGRARRIHMIAAAQRVAEVNTRWRGNESERYIFRAGDERDYQQAARWLPEHKATLRQLRNFEYLHIDAERGSVWRNVTVKPKSRRPKCTASSTPRRTSRTSNKAASTSQPASRWRRTRTKGTEA